MTVTDRNGGYFVSGAQFDYSSCERSDSDSLRFAPSDCSNYVNSVTVPDSLDAMLELAEGKSVLNPKTVREGLVWVSGSGDDRVSFKTISNNFVAKHGD